MDMIRYLVAVGIVALVALGVFAQSNLQRSEQDAYAKLKIEGKSPERKDKLVLTDEEWKKKLTKEQYRVLRRKGTEAAFCSPFLDSKKIGVYHCAACDIPLFKTDAKFVSGTGWPSFFQPIKRKDIWLKKDLSLNMYRLEILCAKCDSHLGHLFPDGPKDKTGLRYCVNGESLKFKEKKD